MRKIAQKFAIQYDALYRHRKHVGQAIVRAAARQEELLGDNLLANMKVCQRKAWELLSKFEEEKDHRGAVVALREARETIGALGSLLASATDSTTLSPQDLSDLTRARELRKMSTSELRAEIEKKRAVIDSAHGVSKWAGKLPPTVRVIDRSDVPAGVPVKIEAQTRPVGPALMLPEPAHPNPEDQATPPVNQPAPDPADQPVQVLIPEVVHGPVVARPALVVWGGSVPSDASAGEALRGLFSDLKRGW